MWDLVLQNNKMENTFKSLEKFKKTLRRDLCSAYKETQKYLEMVINATPTGDERNKLCEENIKLSIKINSLR